MQTLKLNPCLKGLTLCEYWSNVNINNKYPKPNAAIERFLLVFPFAYMVEAGFGHANSILTKERNRINLEERGDLRLKLINIQPNISTLDCTHQALSSH